MLLRLCWIVRRCSPESLECTCLNECRSADTQCVRVQCTSPLRCLDRHVMVLRSLAPMVYICRGRSYYSLHWVFMHTGVKPSLCARRVCACATEWEICLYNFVRTIQSVHIPAIYYCAVRRSWVWPQAATSHYANKRWKRHESSTANCHDYFIILRLPTARIVYSFLQRDSSRPLRRPYTFPFHVALLQIWCLWCLF